MSKVQKLILLPVPSSQLPRGGAAVPSPKGHLQQHLYPCPSGAALTSSQVPGDEAEEDADDITQVLLAAMLTLLQSWGAALAAP